MTQYWPDELAPRNQIDWQQRCVCTHTRLNHPACGRCYAAAPCGCDQFEAEEVC